MKTVHYFITNIQKFSKDTIAVEKLNKYLQDIESIFPTIEDVIGQVWNEGRIYIELEDSSHGANHRYLNGSHVVKMGIYNKNIQKVYPENLWGCLFHETHHAFFNPIIRNKMDGKIFNGGHKVEVFNYAFMATTYLKLKKEGRIDAQIYKLFLSDLQGELGAWNREYRNDPIKYKCEYEDDIEDDAMSIFQKYIDFFSTDIKNLSKFILYLKRPDSVFINGNNFQQNLDKAKKILMQ